jgi:MoaA/NifB/PqqE/SkfB family radical SAM enzyme
MRPRDAFDYGLRFAANALTRGAPRVLYIEVTKRCNAFCGFCPYWQDHRRGELADYAPIVERFRPFCVTFSGGEPLLRRDLPELVARVAALRPKPYTAVLTNGWLLSVERARALRAAGLEQVSISIDYVGAEHDRQRGLPGLYARIASRMADLRAVGFGRICVNTVIMESNLDHVVELARLTHRWGVCSSFSCYSTMKTRSSGELVRPAQLERLRRTVDALKRLKRRQHNIISSDYYLDRVPEYFANGGRVGARCGAAGQRFFHVDPWGYVKICPEFEPFAHWTEVGERGREPPTGHGSTSCWYGCRGENEAPLTLGRLRDIALPRVRGLA